MTHSNFPFTLNNPQEQTPHHRSTSEQPQPDPEYTHGETLQPAGQQLSEAWPPPSHDADANATETMEEEAEKNDSVWLEDNFYNANDYDLWDDYGKSGEKYGWYNGFSDDVIDDAFEGDPEATWNVD